MNKFFDVEDNSFDFHKERKKLYDNLVKLKNLSVEENTLYKKWIETKTLQDRYNSSKMTKLKIWKPEDIFDRDKTLSELNELKPILKLVESDGDLEQWTNLRVFLSTMPYDQNPGRLLRFLMIDENTGKYLGVTSIGSDVTSLTVRDKDIGWTDEHKYGMGKLNNTAIGTTIVPTQPFGYNFLGGKLIASLVTSKYVRDAWKDKYGDEIVGFTTTSLYGPNSMYNGIPYWKNLGVSAGKMFIKPDDDIYDIWHQWLKDNKPTEYESAMTRTDGRTDIPVTGIKQKIITLIFKYTNIKQSDFVHGYKRGVYFAPVYENYREFLTGKISEKELIMKEKFKKDHDGMISWWRNKAIKRFTKIYDDSRIKPDIMFYNKLPFMSWEQIKKMYLKEIGR